MIAVLWIVLLLSIIAVGYASSTRLQAVTASNQIKSIKLRYGMSSALEKGRQEYDKYLRNKGLFSKREEIEGLTGKPLQLWFPRYDPFIQDIDDGQVAIQIRYENSRFDVNTLTSALWNRILSTCGLVREEDRTPILDAVLDWQDADDLHHLEGAETDYYLEQPTGYFCKNYGFQALSELLLIKGITPEIFYGNAEHPGLVNFLSVYGGAAKLDLNCASPEAFSLLEGLSEDELAEILSRRRETPFKSLAEVAELTSPEVYSQLQQFFEVTQTPAYVTISASTWPTDVDPVNWHSRTFRAQ